MNFPRLCLLLPAFLAAAASAAAGVDSRISAVTVYQDRAVVTRTASIELAAGTSDLVFANLPNALNEQSLQVSASGNAPATILDVSAKQTFVDHTPDPRAKELEDKLRALQQRLRGIDDKVQLLGARSSMLDKIETALFAPPSKDVPRPEQDHLDKSLAYLMEQRTGLTADRAVLAEQRTETINSINTVQNQLKEMSSAAGKAFKTVTVRVASTRSGSLDVALTYTVPDASWTPAYDTRVDSSARTAKMDYFGIVRQSTGEDWKDVALTLSTARPSLGGAAPILTAWQIDVWTPPPGIADEEDVVVLSPFQVSTSPDAGYYSSNRLSSTRVGTTFNAPPPPPVETGLSTATVDTSATSAAFRIEVASSVPSDNSLQKVPVTSLSLVAPPEYVTAPKRQAAAFLTSKVTNTSEFPLLAGAMNVFLDGTFVATSGIRTVMPGEKFDLALGVDEGISIKHRRVQKFTEDTGLTGSGKRITYEYLLTIQNNKKTVEKVQVTDQVPLSRNEKIVVKVLAPDAKDVKPSDEGALKWTFDLNPGEKRELTVKFTISHPGDITVAGLE